MKDLKGICCPVCTPFTEGGAAVDDDALKAQIDSMIEAGVHIIAIAGGTGEFAYLRADERRHMAELAARHIDGRAALIVQTSAIATRDAIEFTKHAEGLGADAVLVLPPYFEGPDMAGVRFHYEKLAAATEVPIMVYNIPVHSGIDLTPPFFKQLLEIDGVEYIKDSTGDMVRIQELVATGGKVFNGADPLPFYALMSGCVGAFWGAVNAMPHEAVKLYDLVSSGDYTAARALWQRLAPANLFFWSHVYNPSVKAATNLSGRPVGLCREPVMPLSDAEMAELKEALKPLGITG